MLEGAKDTEASDFTIFTRDVTTSLCPFGSNPSKDFFLTVNFLPSRWDWFHLESPLPTCSCPSAFPLLIPASCMPRPFFPFFTVGNKREMYEHPVFCLASQVMDLTIREYPHHPLHTFPPSSSCFKCSFTLISFLASLSSSQTPPPCLFLSVPICVRVSGERIS